MLHIRTTICVELSTSRGPSRSNTGTTWTTCWCSATATWMQPVTSCSTWSTGSRWSRSGCRWRGCAGVPRSHRPPPPLCSPRRASMRRPRHTLCLLSSSHSSRERQRCSRRRSSMRIQIRCNRLEIARPLTFPTRLSDQFMERRSLNPFIASSFAIWFRFVFVASIPFNL